MSINYPEAAEHPSSYQNDEKPPLRPHLVFTPTFKYLCVWFLLLVLNPMSGATLSFCESPEVRRVAELEFQHSVKAGRLLRHCTFSDKTWLHVCDGADVIRELAGSRKTQTYCRELLLLLLRLGLTPIALSLLHTRDFPAAQSAPTFVPHVLLPSFVSPAMCRIQSPHTCQWVISCPRMRPWPAECCGGRCAPHLPVAGVRAMQDLLKPEFEFRSLFSSSDKLFS